MSWSNMLANNQARNKCVWAIPQRPVMAKKCAKGFLKFTVKHFRQLLARKAKFLILAMACVILLGLLLNAPFEIFSTSTDKAEEFSVRVNKNNEGQPTIPKGFVQQYLRRSCDASDQHPSKGNELQLHPEMISHIRKRVLRRPVYKISRMTYEIDEEGWVKDPSPGQMVKKMIIPTFFAKMKKPGTFFEAGVLDGYTFSTTYYLERIMGWTGLIAEVSPLNDPYKNALRHGRTALTAAACVSPHPFPCKGHYTLLHGANVKLHHLKGGPLPWLGGISQKYSLAASTPMTGRDIASNGSTVYEALVDCYPLASLLVAANLTNLDFLSLDLEGIEKQVLATFPWDVIDVKVVRLDLYDDMLNKTVQSVIDLMKGVGYRFHHELLKNEFIGEADSFIFSKT